jgi:hypothetical protein
VIHTNNASNTGIVGDVGGSGVISGPMWQMVREQRRGEE